MHKMELDVFTIGPFRPRRIVAAFDYNWTLVKPASGFTHSRGRWDVSWYNDTVVARMNELYHRGYCLVVLSNQIHKWARAQLCDQLEQIGVPLKVGIAFKKELKKPSRDLYDKVVTWTWNKNKSFYVGDALGRSWDWSDVDKQMAKNVGLFVRAPEDIFRKAVPLVKTLKLWPIRCQEIVVLVGYPGSGKSTLARNLFEANGYIVVHGSKLLDQAKEALQTNLPVVVDACNPSKEKRQAYIQMARRRKISARCIYCSKNRKQSLAANSRRKRPIPKIVYNLFDQEFDTPSTSEGFCSVLST